MICRGCRAGTAPGSRPGGGFASRVRVPPPAPFVLKGMILMIEKILKYEKLLSYFLCTNTLPPRQKAIKISYYISAITEALNLELTPLRNIGTHPSEVQKRLKMLKPIVDRLFNLFPLLLKIQEIDMVRLVDLLGILYEASASEKVKVFFEKIIKSSSDEIVLSELADVAYDIGLFDVSYKALLKLFSMGNKRVEILYNIALLEYLMGKNESALLRLKKISKNKKKVSFNYGRIAYLMGAIHLSRGDIEQAKKLFKIARGVK